MDACHQATEEYPVLEENKQPKGETRMYDEKRKIKGQNKLFELVFSEIITG